ncbi:IS1096 element passenger TnpR family protein [Cupriavidus basilensis]
MAAPRHCRINRLPDLALALPVCLAGENACPPEDAVGSHGYAEFSRASGGQDPRTAQ